MTPNSVDTLPMSKPTSDKNLRFFRVEESLCHFIEHLPCIQCFAKSSIAKFVPFAFFECG